MENETELEYAVNDAIELRKICEIYRAALKVIAEDYDDFYGEAYSEIAMNALGDAELICR